MSFNEQCPCGSGVVYRNCCKPYITGKKNAPTAVALMRSRYTAYVKHAIDYIVNTYLEKEKANYEGIKKWSEQSTWLGLKIISAQGGDGEENGCLGTVIFEATFEKNGLKNIHHETAHFKKRDDCWFYDDGEITPYTVVRTGEKIGRNDPCPCRSGKKYKYCCGN
jgi:SEC-C motif-containing protein